jgi:nucleoside-diphosphate-sugar epimerase
LHLPKPGSPYAFTKYLAEEAIRAKTMSIPNLRAIVGRLYTCFGPGQPPGFATSDFCHKVAALSSHSGAILKVGPLSSYRRFLDVRDMVKLLPRIMSADLPSRYEVFNIASPASSHEMSLQEVLETLLRIAGKNPKIESSTDSMNTFTGLKLNIEKLKNTLPAFTFRSVEETLRDMYNEVRK